MSMQCSVMLMQHSKMGLINLRYKHWLHSHAGAVMNRMPRGTFTGLSHFFTIANCRPIQCVLMYSILTRVRWYLWRSQFCWLLTSSMKSGRRTMQCYGMPLLVQPLKKLLLFGVLSAGTRPVSGSIQSSSQPEAVRFFLCIFWEVCFYKCLDDPDIKCKGKISLLPPSEVKPRCRDVSSTKL